MTGAWSSVCQPSTQRIVICPEAVKTQKCMALRLSVPELSDSLNLAFGPRLEGLSVIFLATQTTSPSLTSAPLWPNSVAVRYK